MRIGTFFLKLHFFIEGRELAYRRYAELIRAQTATLVNIQLRRSDRLTARSMWHFPWDDQTADMPEATPEEKTPSAERMNKMLDLLDKE